MSSYFISSRKLIKGDPNVVQTDTMTADSTYMDTIQQSEISIVLNKMGIRRGSMNTEFSGFS